SGSRVASRVMSSAKKSGSTTKRPGHSTRTRPAPVPGSTCTVTSPRLMRNLPATSAPAAVVNDASKQALPRPFSTRATPLSRLARVPNNKGAPRLREFGGWPSLGGRWTADHRLHKQAKDRAEISPTHEKPCHRHRLENVSCRWNEMVLRLKRLLARWQTRWRV